MRSLGSGWRAAGRRRPGKNLTQDGPLPAEGGEVTLQNVRYVMAGNILRQSSLVKPGWPAADNAASKRALT